MKMRERLMLILCCEILPSLAQEGLSVRHPPYITQPAFAETRYFHRSSKFNISCRAEGTPTPGYIWQKDGVNIVSDIIHVNPQTGFLLVDGATYREEGVYRCLANNSWGTAVSSDIHMTLVRGGSFGNEGTKTITVKEGSNVSLECRDPPVTVPEGSLSWYTTGSVKGDADRIVVEDRMGVDKKGTLHFAFVVLEDMKIDEEYACAAETGKTDTIVLGSKVKLRVQENGGTASSKPRRVYITDNALVQIGKDAVLECFFSGNPVPTIRWYDTSDNEIVVGSNPRLEITDYNRRLTIRDIKETDEGVYNCEANSSLGQPKESLSLNVTSKPIWVQAPTSRTVVEGTDVTFSCLAKAASGENAPAPPVWFENGEQLLSNDTRIVGRTKFYLPGVSRDRDIMNVQCMVQNEFGRIFQDAYLNVILPIRITARPPKSIRFDDGDVIPLAIVATTDPSETLTYKWKQNGTFITLPRVGFTLNNASTLTINTTEMTTEEVTTAHGMYTCIIRNNHQTKIVEVYLSKTPIDPYIRITSRPPSTVSVKYGDVINLTVSATTHPSERLNYHWSLKGETITSIRTVFSIESGTLTINTSKLATDEMDAVMGMYICNVSNSRRAVSVEVTLKEVTGPVTEGVSTADTGSDLWILAVVLGLLFVIGAAFLVACFLRQRYPKRVYLLEKKELKSKLDPVRDLENDYFQTL